MVERKHRYGNLVFDRDAIVRAALRAYFEGIFGGIGPLRRLSFAACACVRWIGDLQLGAFYNDNIEGDNQVVAWTEAGVVALAYDLGFGPVDHLDLPVSAVTGGPDDVRGALPGLPAELEPALVLASGMLWDGKHGEKLAGMGFWLHGDHVAGSLFDDPTDAGARQLVMWGLLHRGRLWPTSYWFSKGTRPVVLQCYTQNDAPMHALMDRVVDRRVGGPTELMPDEVAMLFPTPPEPQVLLGAQRLLQKVGITWPGSPEIPEPPPRQRINPFTRQPASIEENPSWRDMRALQLARACSRRT